MFVYVSMLASACVSMCMLKSVIVILNCAIISVWLSQIRQRGGRVGGWRSWRCFAVFARPDWLGLRACLLALAAGYAAVMGSGHT